jgi:hypothetical protein
MEYQHNTLVSCGRRLAARVWTGRWAHQRRQLVLTRRRTRTMATVGDAADSHRFLVFAPPGSKRPATSVSVDALNE